MKTMGLSRLVLVAPRVYPHPDAEALAAGGLDVLATATVCATLEEAVADCQLVIGTSARSRSMPWPSVSPRVCGRKVWEEATAGHEVAIVFGREDRGLTNEELGLVNLQVRIPCHPDYPVLNLAAAVQVLAYEVRLGFLARTGDDEPTARGDLTWDFPAATAEAMEHLYEHLRRLMIDVGFYEPENPGQVDLRLRRLFGRIRPDTMEMGILRGFLSAVERRLTR